MKIFVLNCGSSSLKYKLYDMATEEVLADGKAERIGMQDAEFTHKPMGKDKYVETLPIKDHQQAIAKTMDILAHGDYAVISHVNEIQAVGHRVVSGGEYFNQPTLIDQRAKELIQKCSELAPLHNPPAVAGIQAIENILPTTPQVAVFDTSFHATMQPHVYLYALPYELYEKHNIRRYGYHGTSHKYVAMRAANLMGRPLEDMKIVTCHLGNGASITAIKNGQCIDTSMGLTPLEGLIMGTRCGSIDPSIPLYLMEKLDLSTKECNDLMNKQSGMKGLSGISHDMRDIEQAMEEGNERAIQAYDAYVYSIRKYVGAYAAALDGLDCLIFTAGIGENSPLLRSKICSGLSYLDLNIDEDRNYDKGKEKDITTSASKAKVWVIPTDEELMIARETSEKVQ